MRHLLLALLLLPGLAAAMFPHAQDGYVQQRYMIACRLSELNCSGVFKPVVFAVPTGSELGWHYWGTNVVFVTDRCLLDVADQHKCDAVIIHEIVHYLYSEAHKGELPTVEVNCKSEALAWDVYNAYVQEIGRADLVRTDWVRSYPQCAKSQSNSTS
jgi:hypothetical protein